MKFLFIATALALASVPLWLAAAPTGAEKIFNARCAGCHGAKGDGAGKMSKFLKVKPTNFTDAAWQASRTDDQLVEVTKLGGKAKTVKVNKAMPAYPKLTDTELKDLAVLMRGFAPSKGVQPDKGGAEATK